MRNDGSRFVLYADSETVLSGNLKRDISRRFYVHQTEDTMSKRKPITAQELDVELANDPEYQAKRAQVEAEFAERRKVLEQAEQPIIDDLRRVGIDVQSPWDLVNTSEPYPAALPVLLHHLTLGTYPERILQGVGRALAVKPAAVYWDELVALYKSVDSGDTKDGLAVALMVTVTKDTIGELIALCEDHGAGPERIYFLKPIMRLGGGRGHAMVASVIDDPVLGKEATALVSRATRRNKSK